MMVDVEMVGYEEPEDIPTCGGYSVWTDYGYEFDCEYAPPWNCEECLVNWDIGGKYDPRCSEDYRRYEGEESE